VKQDIFKKLSILILLLSLDGCWANPIWQEILNEFYKVDSNSDSKIGGILALLQSTVSTTVSSYTVGGSVTGLTGSGLKLENNSEILMITTSGRFVFSNAFADLASYKVSVQSNPTNPSETCSVSNGSGTISGKDITDVSIVCSMNSYTVSGNISGLLGSGLVLQNNLGDDINISANGSFTFSQSIADTSNFNVSVLSNPTSPSQICSASNNTGTVNGANVNSITIVCSTNSYTIGGMITGLSGSGLILRNNGGDDLSVSNGSSNFTFSQSIADGQTFNVTTFSQPTTLSQNCTVSSGSGTVNGANINSISISCSTQSFTIGGTVTGYAGAGMVLQNNGGDSLPISGNGAFSFSTSLLDGSSYVVTVSTQPTGTSKSCSVNNSSGNLSNANVTNVLITCVAPTEVSGIQLWLKGDVLALGNGASVSNWLDSSGSSWDAIQGTATSQPIFYTNSINGLPVLSFDGSNDYMQGNAFDVSNNTIFIVARFYQQSANNNGIFSFFPSSGNDWDNANGFAISYKDSTATLKPKYERQAGVDLFVIESSIAAGVHLLSMNFGSGTGSIYVDGTTLYSDTYSPTAPTIMPSYYVIGARPAVGGYYGQTDFAEIIIYNTKLINTERQKLECYLKAKYNLSSVSNASCT
jgi:hypothetical protein